MFKDRFLLVLNRTVANKAEIMEEIHKTLFLTNPFVNSVDATSIRSRYITICYITGANFVWHKLLILIRSENMAHH